MSHRALHHMPAAAQWAVCLALWAVSAVLWVVCVVLRGLLPGGREDALRGAAQRDTDW